MLLGIGIFAMAQDYSEYLDLAMEKLKAKDCDAAQKYYNVYKDLSKQSLPSVEVLIEDCKTASANGPKQVQINYQDYEVLPADLDDTYKWKNAKSVCENLTAFGKSDWYLPSKEELAGLYKHKGEIGGFTNLQYWSSSPGDSYDYVSTFAWWQSFDNGYKGSDSQNDRRHVRCIRKK